MANRKYIRMAEQLGKDPEQIQAVLTRVNPSTRAQWIYCAGQLGCDPVQLEAEAAKPAPVPIVPVNWTAATGGLPFGTYAGPGLGLAPIAFPGPSGGFTWGPPVYVRPAQD